MLFRPANNNSSKNKPQQNSSKAKLSLDTLEKLSGGDDSCPPPCREYMPDGLWRCRC